MNALSHVGRRLRGLARRPALAAALAAAALLGVYLLGSAAGWFGVQLGPGPLARSAGGALTAASIARPVGVHTYGGFAYLQNTTASPMVVVALAPVDHPRGATVAVVLLRNSMAARGIHVHAPKGALHLPMVLPPKSPVYVAAVAMTLRRPEYAAVWGIWVTYWWRGTLYHDYLPFAFIDCVNNDATCQTLNHLPPPAWPPTHPVPSRVVPR
jgi:hypothetical protein